MILEHQAEILSVSPIEIYASARSSDQVDESKSTRLLRFRLLLGEDRSIQKRTKDGKIFLKNFDSPILTQNYLEWMENRLRSSGIFSQDLRRWRSSRRTRKTYKIETLNPESLKIESSSRQCSMTSNGHREEIQRNVFQIPNKSENVFKTISALSRGIQRRRTTETPYTSMRTHRTQKSCFAQFTQQISSVSTEQSAVGVKNSV